MSRFFDPSEDIDKTKHNLPHWQQGESFIFLTYRLADSLPQEKLSYWKHLRQRFLDKYPLPWDEATEELYHTHISQPIDKALDAGAGSCLLEQPKLRKIVTDALHHFNDQRYQLDSYVIMPNHVHILFQSLNGHQLPDLVKIWKGYTAREINKATDQAGTLWQADYYDRLIRSQDHLDWTRRYIQENPKHLPKNAYTHWRRS